MPWAAGLDRDGAATRLVLAFSRETAPLEPPQYAGYVQAALVAEGPLLDAQVLQHPRAHIFVCGYGALVGVRGNAGSHVAGGRAGGRGGRP